LRAKTSNDDKQYAYVSVFEQDKIAISTDLNKKSDRFIAVDLPK